MSPYPDEYSFKNREISWLSFNGRVLQEAEDKKNPLYERIRFLAIFSSNLDEFFRVRVSKLRQIKNVEKSIRKKLKLRPTKTLRQIIATVEEQQERFGEIFGGTILPELAENGIHLIGYESFTSKQRQFAQKYYEKELSEHIGLVPIASSETPFLLNNALYFFVCFEKGPGSFVLIPSESNNRFVRLPNHEGQHYITFVDDIVAQELPSMFPERTVEAYYEIKLSRDAELYWEDDFQGGVAKQIKESLSQRKGGQPTRLLYDYRMPAPIRKQLRKLLDLGKVDMFPGGKYHNYSDFMDFPDPTDSQDLHFESLPPLVHPVFSESNGIFDAIRHRDRILHFPYHSFDGLLHFFEAAASDPLVKTLKISIYRMARDSRLGHSLLQALENGKEVIVFVEPKARFDEANNLDWSNRLEEKGAKVFHSDLLIKVHSKILMVDRLEEGSLIRYAYLSTGNFNRKTSKIYSDHGLFTANEAITEELSQVFEVLERRRLAPVTKHLLVSPFNTRVTFMELIDNEIHQADNGMPAGIRAKMNSLHDKRLITKLYQAARSGVKIRLLVRGFSCLDMGFDHVHQNITITSVVDRFLEHGRIYWFQNGDEPKMYIGSADWMTRNLDRRIEVLTPIYDENVFAELEHILELQFRDNVKARIVDEEESNTYVEQAKGETKIRSQYAIYDYLKDKID